MSKNLDKLYERSLKTFLTLEFYGIHIEEVKEGTDVTYYYFSVPETSNIHNEKADDDFNKRIKNPKGLISIAKRGLLEIIIDSCREQFGKDEEFLTEIRENYSDYFKFYAKIRNGEEWNGELGKAAIKKLLKDAEDKAYEEV